MNISIICFFGILVFSRQGWAWCSSLNLCRNFAEQLTREVGRLCFIIRCEKRSSSTLVQRIAGFLVSWAPFRLRIRRGTLPLRRFWRGFGYLGGLAWASIRNLKFLAFNNLYFIRFSIKIGNNSYFCPFLRVHLTSLYFMLSCRILVELMSKKGEISESNNYLKNAGNINPISLKSWLKFEQKLIR